MRDARLAIVLCGLMLAVFAAAPIAGAPAAPRDKGPHVRLQDPIPMDPEVTIGKLDNGLTYYIRVNRDPEKRAYVMLAVNAGSVLEDNDQVGLAHFVEHMGFNGTKHFPKQELIKYLESVGVQFGSQANAGTGFDQTVYRLTIPTDTTAIVEKAFQVLEDWSRWINMETEEIENERGVIVEEWRLGLGAGERIFNKQLPVLLKDSRYALRLPIGNKDSLRTFKPDAARRFYRDWYRPDLMAVVAVGDFDPKWIRSLIEQHFAAMPRVEHPRPRTVFPVPDHVETLYSIESDPEKTGTDITLYFKSDPPPEKTLADYRRDLILRLHQDMFRQRLVELSQKPDPPVLGSMLRDGRLVRSKDYYFLASSVKEAGLDRGLEALLTEVERVKKHGFIEPELGRVKERWIRVSQWSDQREKVKSDTYAGQCVENFLNGEPIVSPAAQRDLYEKLMPGISLEEVNELSGRWFGSGNCVILVSAPEKEGLSLPTEDALRAVFARVEQAPVEPYTEAQMERPLLAQTPRPGTIVKELKRPAVGITEWTLSNGARVILKPSDFDRERIFFSAFSPGGLSLVSNDSFRSAAYAQSVIQECGVGDFGREDLKKKLMGTLASAGTQMGELTEDCGGKAYTKDIETMFDLLYLRFTAPRMCDDEFKAFLVKMREYVKNKSADPQRVFQDTMQATMTRYNPRYRPMTEAGVDSIDLAAAFRVYKDRFADASGFTFIFTGDFEVDKLKPFVRTYIGGLPSLNRSETWRDLGIEPPAGVVKKVVHKGIAPKSSVYLVFTGPYEWSRENQAAMGLMTEVLQTKLREVIREEKSGTYGVGVSGSGVKYPRSEYGIYISFGCAPERVDELVAAVFAQIDTLKMNGPGESYVQRAKETKKRYLEEKMKDNGFWATNLREAYFLKENPDDILKDPGISESISPQRIRDAARTYFDMKNYMQFVLMPEKESGK
jgi:zinc protease